MVQVIQNKLLKLLLRLDPYTSTNMLHSGLNILKVKDLYDTSLLLFVHANLQGDCPAAVKNYFVRTDLATWKLGYKNPEIQDIFIFNCLLQIK